ncbi:MAG TPA: CoA transferase, partial [Candidatus Dormibacteraeota bacterium]
EVGRGDHRLTGRYACYRVYACKDGGYYSVGALEPKFWTALCNAVGAPELIEIQFAAGDERVRAHRTMEAVFQSRTRSEWERELAGLEVCCEPVLDLNEVATHPQIASRGLVVNGPAGVEVRPAVPMRADWRRRDAPALGEHTAEILSEVGIDGTRLAALEKEGAI